MPSLLLHEWLPYSLYRHWALLITGQNGKRHLWDMYAEDFDPVPSNQDLHVGQGTNLEYLRRMTYGYYPSEAAASSWVWQTSCVEQRKKVGCTKSIDKGRTTAEIEFGVDFLTESFFVSCSIPEKCGVDEKSYSFRKVLDLENTQDAKQLAYWGYVKETFFPHMDILPLVRSIAQHGRQFRIEVLETRVVDFDDKLVTPLWQS